MHGKANSCQELPSIGAFSMYLSLCWRDYQGRTVAAQPGTTPLALLYSGKMVPTELTDPLSSLHGSLWRCLLYPMPFPRFHLCTSNPYCRLRISLLIHGSSPVVLQKHPFCTSSHFCFPKDPSDVVHQLRLNFFLSEITLLPYTWSEYGKVWMDTNT